MVRYSEGEREETINILRCLIEPPKHGQIARNQGQKTTKTTNKQFDSRYSQTHTYTYTYMYVCMYVHVHVVKKWLLYGTNGLPPSG